MASGRTLQDKLVVITGGSGFFGRHVAQALLDQGARLRIASRNPEKAFVLKPLANLGQIQFARCDVTNPASVKAAMIGADAVVNLVGAFDGDLMQLIAGGAENVAEAAADAGAGAMVHISAIGADLNSEAEYARAKAQSELDVLAAFPSATVLRPSLLFGEDDGFLALFSGMISTLPVLPVFAPHAPLQMLFVDDAADAVVAALANPGTHGGKTYEIAGDEAITMLELHQRIAAAQGRKRIFIEMPDTVSGIFAALPGTPMGRDQWILLKQGNVPSGKHPGIHKLGIDPRPLELFLERWMVKYRKHGRFAQRMPGGGA
ncbi:SDR family NAD(P)-dependent oxidoreductase [Allopontixanthobacter sediminis]|uniref:SDR family NAD(P)-dependent oxidoreductase n=1 Tax=Allopontixanthobacter sediminis TaxID=1689985 RepID=A0A845B3S1_9SPHN|nr:SDR family NAD(P)-dependent oxidoreductase [Allopontixanthobacter sediminis]MXP44836.1 SDR family NAD(P)-dependent oxidoreductase [Allopontixanthobacter sediminis]